MVFSFFSGSSPGDCSVRKFHREGVRGDGRLVRCAGATDRRRISKAEVHRLYQASPRSTVAETASQASIPRPVSALFLAVTACCGQQPRRLSTSSWKIRRRPRPRTRSAGQASGMAGCLAFGTCPRRSGKSIAASSTGSAASPATPRSFRRSSAWPMPWASTPSRKASKSTNRRRCCCVWAARPSPWSGANARSGSPDPVARD